MLLGALPAPLLASAAADEPGVISLPPFFVEENAQSAPWRYAELPGLEILSRSSERTTRALTASFVRLHQLLGEILPAALQVRLATPTTLILCDSVHQVPASQEVMKRLLEQGAASAAGRENLGAPGGGLGGLAVSVPRYRFLPNLRLWDRDAMAVFSLVNERDFDRGGLALTDDYVQWLVRRHTPPLPAWFEVGFLALFKQVEFEEDRLTISPLGEAMLAPLQQNGKPALLPLAQLFAPEALVDAADPVALARWRAQAVLFVRWAYDGLASARRAAFWKFVERAAGEGADERLFRECFGCDLATADAQLVTYYETGVPTPLAFSLPRRTALPAFTVSLATGAEIARIKGDWERLEIAHVKERLPAVAPKYVEQARRTLLTAFARGDRDPRLLAVLGLFAVDTGDDAAAREYLEAAALRSAALRPRAWVELARLRLAAARAQPAGGDGRLSADQSAGVLQPLFAARALQPPQPELYELIADVWAHSAVPPTRGHLGAIDEGVRLFPNRTGLVLGAAELNLAHGHREEAQWLAHIGLVHAADAAARARFSQLLARIAAPSAP